MLPKMMLGFVVRRCTVAVGHKPSAEEFAKLANNYRQGDRTICLFGRPISISEARAILRHPGREVSAHSAKPAEQLASDDGLPSLTVVRFASAVARLKNRRRKS